VAMSGEKIHLIIELFASGALAQYEFASFLPTIRVRPKESSDSWLAVMPDERAELHQRDKPNAELNDAKIFKDVNDYLRTPSSYVPVNPETLSAKLAEIDAEIRSDENDTLKF